MRKKSLEELKKPEILAKKIEVKPKTTRRSPPSSFITSPNLLKKPALPKFTSRSTSSYKKTKKKIFNILVLIKDKDDFDSKNFFKAADQFGIQVNLTLRQVQELL